MNTLTTAKVLGLLAMVFVAGGAAGAVLASKNAHRQEVQSASMEKACTRFQDRLKVRLNLSDDQVKKFQPVFDDTAEQLQTARRRAIRETDVIICRAHERIAQQLSASQKEKLAAMDRERSDWMRQRLDGHDLAKEH